MLQEAFAGNLPWKDVAEYMLFLAFLATLTGMVFLSYNKPLVLHTISYTVSGIMVAYMSMREHMWVTRLQKWNPKVSSSLMV